MAIVTGDRYLDNLVKFVEKEACPLLEGGLILKLNPVGPHYVQSQLEQLQELEGLLAGAPVDYLRAYVLDLGDHRMLEQLRRILQLLTSLEVVSIFSQMDEYLQILPAVEIMDLSQNRFAKVDNLRKCTKLKHLDLGFNHLRTIASLSEVLCPIVKLVLRNNALTTLRGIENLKSVEGLDLSYTVTPCRWLEVNPICYARWYRTHDFSIFTLPDKLKLDDRGISRRGFWKRQIILASQQKRPAGQGFYSPAKAEDDGGSSFSAKRKKLSHLACIYEDGKRSLRV